ncbi:MAG: hypothetical protein K6G30_03835 [Acetatifactor sp.]|nr:hypothetical protein [Acetatifactor sp.]
MGQGGLQKKDAFSEAIAGKKLPVLTLDNKWYKLLGEVGREAMQNEEEALNALLKKQGKINTELKDIKRLKKKLMSEIVPMVDEMEQGGDAKLEKKIEEHKRLVEECNEKIEAYQDEMLDIPKELDHLNGELMLSTMANCYDTIQENTSDIAEIEKWVAEIRVELKKKLIRKQEMEQKNHEIYSYMHDIFGAEVMNLFDLKYDPEQKHPKKPGETTPNEHNEGS